MKDKIIAEDFKIKKEDKKDYKKSVIQRCNLTNEFTLADLESHKVELDKMERELLAQVRVSTAAIENVGRNHPFVSKMTDEALAVAHYLSETKELLAKTESKLKDVKTTRKKYEEVMKVVMDKFGFVESNVMEDGKA